MVSIFNIINNNKISDNRKKLLVKKIRNLQYMLNNEFQQDLQFEEVISLLNNILEYVQVKTFIEKYSINKSNLSLMYKLDLLLKEVPEEIILYLCQLELSNKSRILKK